MQLKPLALLLLVMVALPGNCLAQTLNSRVTAFLAGKVGARCGGGECAHSVTEALRVAGAEFVPTDLGPDTPAAGDYVWGTSLKAITITNGRWTDSRPTTKLIPGDVIQYRNTRFVKGGVTSFASQHTSVVAAVTSSGMPTFVFEQNFNGIRSVRRNAIDLTRLTAGYLRIYRPKARITRTGQYKFTLTNNMPASQALSITIGNSVLGRVSLTQANTLNSYQTRWVTITGSTTPISLRLPSGQTLNVVSPGGYEIYRTSNGSPALRRISP